MTCDNTYCHVCGDRTKSDRDYMEYVLMESYEICTNCRLYSYDYLTGNVCLQLGLVEKYWGWSDPQPLWIDQTPALSEAKRLWAAMNDPVSNCGALMRGYREDPTNVGLILADWLQENDYPLNEEAVRERHARQVQ